MTEHNETFLYDAFISYRHIPRDMKIAKKLHEMLENYRTPKYLVDRGFPYRLKKVFRDRDELPTSCDLGQDIQDALIHARFLIVICSPEALESLWVQQEVEFFGKYHGYDKILTLLVAGEPDTAFPKGLIRYLHDGEGRINQVIEPLAADIRPNGKETALQLLKVEKLRLIAGILGCKYDDLRQREHMRRVRRIITISSSAVVFLIAFGAFALWQLSEVSKAKSLAVQNEQNALNVQSKLYATLAKRTMDEGDSLLGMSLALEALPKDLSNPEKPMTQEAVDAVNYTSQLKGLYQITTLYPGNERYNRNIVDRFCGFLVNGDIYTSNGQTVWTYSGETGRIIHSWTVPEGYQIRAVSPKGDRVFASQYTNAVGITVQLWDIDLNKKLVEYTCKRSDENVYTDRMEYPGMDYFIRTQFDTVGKYCFIADNAYISNACVSSIEVLDSETGERVSQVPVSGEIQSVSFERNDKILVFSPDHVLLYDFIKNSAYYDGVGSTPLKRGAIDSEFGRLSTDEQRLAYFDVTGQLISVDLKTKAIAENELVKANQYLFSQDGSMVAFWNDENGFNVYQLNTGEFLYHLDPDETNLFTPISQFYFSPDNRFIVTYKMVIDLQKKCYFQVANKGVYVFGHKSQATSNEDKMVLIDENVTASVYQLPNESEYHETMVPYGSFLFVNNYLISYDGANYAPGSFSIIDCKSKAVVQQYDTILRYFISAPDLIIFQDSDFTVRIFDTKSGAVVKEIGMNDVIGDIQCSSDGKWMAIMGRYGHIDMMNRETNETIRGIDIEADRYGVINTYHSYGFFPDNNRLWVYGEFDEGMGVRIYDTAGNLLSFTLTSGSSVENIYYAFLNPAGTCLALSIGTQFTLWHIDAKNQMTKVSEVSGSFGDLDDRYFVTLNGDAAYVYDWDTSRFVSIIEGNGIDYVQLIDDGSRLLLSDNRGVFLYNTKTGEKIAPFCQEYGSFPGLWYADVSLINDNSEIAIIHYIDSDDGYVVQRRSYLMTFPYLNTFDAVYTEALQQLHGRTFDPEQDFEHIS